MSKFTLNNKNGVLAVYKERSLFGKCIELKILERYANEVFVNNKRAEFRYNDRDYQKGDTIIFKVINDTSLNIEHPLNNIPFVITHVLHIEQLKGWVMLSIEREDM